MKSRLKPLLLSLLFLTSCSEKSETEDYSIFVGVDKIVTNVESLELYVKESFTISAEVKPNSATIKNITFKSDNSSIATCSSSGKVEGRSAGKCNIIISSDENNSFQKKIPVLVKKEDRNRQKEGTVKIEAKLDMRGLASESISEDNLEILNYNDKIYAPFVNTYNTTSDDFLDLSDRIKILSDVNYYGNIEGETSEERNNRILSNMNALFVTSTGVNTILSAIGSEDASDYSEYYGSILTNYLALRAAKSYEESPLHIPGTKPFEAAIRNSPEQHSLLYINNDYFSNARLEETATSKKCTYYLYEDNTIDSMNALSSLTPVLNYANVEGVKEYFTQDNLNKIIAYIKTNFDKLPIQYSIYYELLRNLINSIDENSYLVTTSEIYTIDGKDAVDASFSLSDSGREQISQALIGFITTRISTSDNEELKNKVAAYINGFGLSKLEHTTTFVNRSTGSGVNVYKINNEIAFSTATLSDQSIKTELLYKLDLIEIPSTFFFEEETRQQSYRK